MELNRTELYSRLQQKNKQTLNYINGNNKSQNTLIILLILSIVCSPFRSVLYRIGKETYIRLKGNSH